MESNINKIIEYSTNELKYYVIPITILKENKNLYEYYNNYFEEQDRLLQYIEDNEFDQIFKILNLEKNYDNEIKLISILNEIKSKTSLKMINDYLENNKEKKYLFNNSFIVAKSLYSILQSLQITIKCSKEKLKNIDCDDVYLCLIKDKSETILISVFVSLIDITKKTQEHVCIFLNIKVILFDKIINNCIKSKDLLLKLNSFCVVHFNTTLIYLNPSPKILLHLLKNNILIKNVNIQNNNKCLNESYNYVIIVDDNLKKIFKNDIKQIGGIDNYLHKYLKYKNKYKQLRLIITYLY